MDKLKSYFVSGELWVWVVSVISVNVVIIVKEVVVKFLLYFDVICFGGNMYIICCYVVCICDLDYYFCYVIYVMLVGDVFIFDECVFNGLKEIYNFFGVFIFFIV